MHACRTRLRVLTTIVFGLGLLALFGAMSLPRARAATATEFVQRCGIHFCLNNGTYYFAGANTYDVFTFGGSYGDTETQYMDKSRIDNHFAQLRADKVDVLRLWMFSHEDWHGFETTRGVYNDQEFALFDYVIESARKSGIKLIPVFENYWEAYGGIDTRLKWEGLTGGQPGRSAFFDKTKCPGCFASYKGYVNYALNRTNHYSGVKYKDDPTIFAWELMNEPRYQDVSAAENVSGATLRAWVDEMGAYIKGIDPNHMLGTGLEGHQSKYGFGGDEGNPFVTIHQSPYIDFTSAHPYPTEEWANLSLAQTKSLIRAWITDSHEVVGKPFFMGEFNFKNVDRATWWSSVYADFEAAGGDGSAFWWYLDPANTASDNYSVKKGAAELAAFRSHSAAMAAKRSGLGTPTGPGGTSIPPSSTPPVNPSNSSVPPRTCAAGSPGASGCVRPGSSSPSIVTSPPRTCGAPGGTGGCYSPPMSPPISTPPSSPPRTCGAGAIGCVIPYACNIHYKTSGWANGFIAEVTLTNTGFSALSNWNLSWTFTDGQVVTSGWNATLTQTNAQVTATNMPWNATLPVNAAISFGFQGTHTGTNSVPTNFRINGSACSSS